MFTQPALVAKPQVLMPGNSAIKLEDRICRPIICNQYPHDTQVERTYQGLRLSVAGTNKYYIFNPASDLKRNSVNVIVRPLDKIAPHIIKIR